MRILIVDDEEIQRVTIGDDIADLGHEIRAVGSAQEALHLMDKQPFDLVITDLRMPEMDGLEFLKAVKKETPQTEVIVMTAYATVKTAVEAIQNGAYNYLTKPFEMDELHGLITRVEEIKNLREENLRLKAELRERHRLGNLVGKSPAMNQIYDQIKAVATTDTAVLITGPTGTGKEVVADTIHYESDRSRRPLVKVSCAILSREILESELFGHEKGAFTGATREKKGRFEMAQGGTIYLDDVDDIPMDLQVKLLRVLQEKEVERVGGTKSIPLDVRVIASTKYDLGTLVNQKKFRADLYYRLNVFPINLPPLKDRKEDIPLLLDYFFNYFAPGKKCTIGREAMVYFMDYPWEGNVRELKNIVERISISCQCERITPECLPREIYSPERSFESESVPLEALNLSDSLKHYEEMMIKKALTSCQGNRAAAARQLGIPVSTLKSKLKKYHLD
jgi:DNA-binding NtrC family response regulator